MEKWIERKVVRKGSYIYVLSNARIEEGDLFLDFYENKIPANVRRCVKVEGVKVYDAELTHNYQTNLKKIIASSDVCMLLPLVEAALITRLEATNKDSVLVKYEENCVGMSYGSFDYEYELALDSHFYIVTKPVPPKDNFTKEELKRYCELAFFAGFANGSLSLENGMEVLSKWIKENVDNDN